MSLIRIPHSPSRRQLFVFAVCWAAFFAFVGGAALTRGGSLTAAILWALAGAVPIAGWGSPKLVRGLFIGTAWLALPLGFVVSYMMLGMVYYFVFTPTGLLMRLFGHAPLNRRFDPDAESYWVPRPEQTDWKRYFRQF